jgi:hypothetical protein
MSRGLTTTAKLAAVLVATAGFVAAGAAFACTPKPQDFTLSQAAGPRAAEVSVRGVGVAPRGAVAIRWNSATGPVLAETTADNSGSFSAPVRIPGDAEGGVSYIVAVAGDNGGVARAAYQVTGTGQTAEAAAPAWSLATDPALADGGSSGPSAPIVAGVGMLTLGLVGLFTGFAVVSVRSRRAPANLG